LAAIVWKLPGAHANVCGDVYVKPSTSIEPTGLAVTIIETVAGEDVVLVELAVDETVELIVELVVVVVVVVWVVDVLVELMLVVLVVVAVVCDPIVNV
jgi:hypothetical protein